MFIKRYKDFLNEVRDKAVKPAGDDVDNERRDEETEKEVEKYLDKNSETCPRCGEHQKNCNCKENDHWSTQTYHRTQK